MTLMDLYAICVMVVGIIGTIIIGILAVIWLFYGFVALINRIFE